MATKKTKKKHSKKTQKSNGQNKLLGIIILILIVAFLVFIAYKIVKLIAVPTDTFIIENGSISSEESVTGYVIRDEKIVKGQNYKNGMSQIKTEGEKVAKGDYIFRYYGSNEEKLNEDIKELNNFYFTKIIHLLLYLLQNYSNILIAPSTHLISSGKLGPGSPSTSGRSHFPFVLVIFIHFSFEYITFLSV